MSTTLNELTETLDAAEALAEIQVQIACDKGEGTLPKWWTEYHTGALNMGIASAVKRAGRLAFHMQIDASKAADGSATGATDGC